MLHEDKRIATESRWHITGNTLYDGREFIYMGCHRNIAGEPTQHIFLDVDRNARFAINEDSFAHFFGKNIIPVKPKWRELAEGAGAMAGLLVLVMGIMFAGLLVSGGNP